jgi:tetratricopeptide (TPR) repeat protein
MKNIIILFFWLIGSLGHSQDNLQFDQANSLYNNGKYEAAISAYENILENNLHSSALYFNMANCYYKLNKTGPSIYYYEKALKLAPNDKDIQNNLSFARQMTIDQFDTIPELETSTFYKKTAQIFSLNGWAIFCILLMCVCVGFFIAYFLSYNTKTKRFFFIMGVISVLILIISFVLLNKKIDLDNERYGIIYPQEINVKTEPNLRSETAFVLHEGTKVQIIESFQSSWLKIKLINGNIGWISKNALKEF